MAGACVLCRREAALSDRRRALHATAARAYVRRSSDYSPTVLSREEVEVALGSGYVLRGFELKGPGVRTDPHFFAKVTRAALGLGNLRDGGHVIIGIADANPAAMLPGLDQPSLESWLAYDDVARKLAEYADPPLRFDLARVELSTGAVVVAMQVFEFADIPHICARDYEGVLRKGALYVRSRRVPETSEIPSSVDMREVVDLATEKALRAYIETAERAGVALTTAGASAGAEADDEAFDAERGRAWD